MYLQANCAKCHPWQAVLQRSLAQLSAYVDKYKKRLNTKNLVYVRQIIAVLRGLLRFLSEKPPALSSTQEEEQAGKVNGIANSIVMHEVSLQPIG